MMIVMVCFGFVSCSSDDDGGGSYSESELLDRLQGVWQFTKGTENIMGMTITMDRSTLSQIRESMEQTMGSKVEFWDETLTFNGTQVNGVSFTLKGNELILDGVDAMDGVSISIKSLNLSTLVLHEVISMEGVDLTADMEYSKK